MQTTVTVVAQLPKVEVRLDAPQTSAQVPGDETLSKPEAGLRDQGGASGGAGKPSEGVQTVAAFKGQILHWRLYCVSSGRPADVCAVPGEDCSPVTLSQQGVALGHLPWADMHSELWPPCCEVAQSSWLRW